MNKEINTPVYLLISIFSVASWADIRGMWIELPVTINILPEGWMLPSRMCLVLQSANIAPFLYSIVCKISSMKNKAKTNRAHNRKDLILSFVIIILEIIFIFFISFFWDYTISYVGKSHSVALLVLFSCSGLCSCLSNVVFLPYLSRYPAQYISAYYLGNGIGGIVPGLMGLFQGIGEDPSCVNITMLVNESCSAIDCETKSQIMPEYPEPNFSVQVYFLLICVLLITSLISFYCLNYTSLVKHQSSTVAQGCVYNVPTTDGDHIQNDLSKIELNEVFIKKKSQEAAYSSFELVYVLLLVVVVNAFEYGVLPSILPFSCLSYGNVTYNLSVRFSNLTTAIISIVYLFLPRSNFKIISGITFIGLAGSVYHIVLSLQSPYPMLQHEIIGSAIVVITTVVLTICFAYVRVALASELHSYSGRRALLWCGVVTQIGSFTGTMITFVLINCTSLFVSKAPCSELIT